jgi:hypothetical protein
VISQISIPEDIGQENSSATMTENAFGGTPLAPQWASQLVRQRTSSGDSFPSSPVAPKPYSAPGSPNSHRSNSPELATMSYNDLQARKRDLKQQLKLYDMNFAKKHGRMPVKAEKEPIRHLYESYNNLKSAIARLEQEGGRHSIPSPVPSPVPSPLPQQRTVSPPSEGSADENSKANTVPARNKRKLPKAPTGGAAVATTASDLAALKAEKQTLHTMLRSYEKEFYREHKRQVSSFNDIKPVASQYRRYKEIKKSIAAMQSGGEK